MNKFVQTYFELKIIEDHIKDLEINIDQLRQYEDDLSESDKQKLNDSCNQKWDLQDIAENIRKKLFNQTKQKYEKQISNNP